MNKSEKLIVVLLGLVLAGWVWHSVGEQKKAAADQARQAAAQRSARQAAKPVQAANGAVQQTAAVAPAQKPAPEARPEAPRAPERLVKLANELVELTLSSRNSG